MSLARRTALAALSGVVMLLTLAVVSHAAPLWRIDSLANTTAAPGAQQRYIVQVTNVGDQPAPITTGGDPTNCSGGPAPEKCYVVRGTLPAGLTLSSVSGIGSCTIDAPSNSFTCPVSGSDPSDQVAAESPVNFFRRLTVTADVNPGAFGVLTASFSVSGGEAANSASTADPTRISSTLPPFGFDAFDASVTDPAGNPVSQAGAHPYEASTSIDFNTMPDPKPVSPNPFFGLLYPVEALKDLVVDLPPGFIGDPTIADQCTLADLVNGAGPSVQSLCPVTSQVGTVIVRLNGLGQTNILGPLPLYNMIPPPNEPARFAFDVLGTVVTLDATVRSGSDYGVTVKASDATELALAGVTATLWGVPSDPSHDLERACPGQLIPIRGGGICHSGAPLRAFLRNPTSCSDPGVGLPTTASMDSWENPGAFVSRTFRTHDLPGYPLDPSQWGRERGTENCSRVPFNPGLSGRPAAGARAGEPAGFSFDLTLPQNDDPNQIGESDLRKAVVTLPAGVRVSPAEADGLAGCSSADIALGSAAAPTCPDAAKIGSVTIDTPLLRDPLHGGIYLATPFDNPFGSLVAVYIVASGSGVVIKLPGQVSLDQTTGQITTTFDNNPQTPFSDVHLEFNDGPRAPLTLPSQCGTYRVHSELTSWSGAVVDIDSPFTVTQNDKGDSCPSTFSPTFRAGTENPVAGANSPFHMSLLRDDSDQELQSITLGMPEGLTARIANANLCSEVDAQHGTCPDSSKIGDVTVGAGAGPDPFYITNGRAYITGPYKGAPFGLSIVVPAVAGPFNLGNVNVRSALFVDKHDASVRVVTDPLPTILQGIPIDTRDVRVAVDKAGFMLNPTSCAVKAVSGAIASVEGATANVSSRFQVGECAILALKSRMPLDVGGAGHTSAGATTPLTTRLTMPSGGTNLRFVQVTLPKTINARLTVINHACTRAQFEADLRNCAHARVGTASAVTPLLRDPLRGNVYFVKNGHPLPDLFIALRGQVSFDLIGRITIPGSTRLRTTFTTVPDVPVRSFTLRLFGDSTKDASIGVAANLCAKSSRAQKAQLEFIGQNGKVLKINQALTVHGCPKPKKRGR